MEGINPNVGRYFGNYQITAEIACGSFGCVYRAQHMFLPRTAAIKILHTKRLHSQRAHQMFLQEAKILEKLKHPHILPIYEFGIDDRLPYLVIEYASGGSLRDLLNSWAPKLLPVAEAVFILSQIGDALYFAHQQGVIHHDLKPENILFNDWGDALLADFGIAIVRTTATLEQITEVNGTPTYMAPEQFRGRVSKRSDQYSLGCIAYELVTGRQPFRAPDAIAMGFKHIRERPIPPTQLNPGLSSQIEQVILKALEKRRANRYPDVLTFINELLSFHTAQTFISTIPQTNSPNFFHKTKGQYLNEGIILSKLERYTEALTAYEQALRLDPNFVDAFVGKGNALYWLGRHSEALVAFERAIELAPDNPAIYNNKGGILYTLGRYVEALTAYEQALRLDPHLASANHGKNLVLRRLGRL